MCYFKGPYYQYPKIAFETTLLSDWKQNYLVLI